MTVLCSRVGKLHIASTKHKSNAQCDDDENDEALKILAVATILSDPVKELATVVLKVLRLTDNTTPSASDLPSGEVHFDECPCARYALPSVPIQCNTPGMKAVPFVTHILSPRKMSFWAVRRPVEVDEDEDQLVDIGGGVFAPKRNIAKLRRAAAAREKNAPRYPAEKGRMSLLQACRLTPVEVLPPLTIPLGKPISLQSSTVLDASTILDQDFQYIDDVDISDSESEDLDSDEGDDEDEEEAEGKAEEKAEEKADGIPQSEGVETVTMRSADIASSRSTSDGEPEEPQPLGKLPSSVTAVSKTEKLMESTETPAVRKLPSRSSDGPPLAKKSFSDVGAQSSHNEIDREIAFAPLMRRIDDAERERNLLQRELSIARAERERLLEELRSLSLVSRCASLESELITLRTAHARLQRDYADATARLSEAEKPELTGVPQEEKEALISLGQKYKKKMRETQQENERLLIVIGQLSRELEMQPGAPQVLSELAETKTDLVVERAENERLKRELARLKSGHSPTSVTEESRSAFS